MRTMISEPARDCPLCPRLVAFRHKARDQHPEWFNAPVPSFGDHNGSLLIVGLAPGLNGANRTGRPFTGDFAGDLLYQTLIEFGLAKGRYGARPDDGLVLVGCLISYAVFCLKKKNKPTPAEVKNCRPFLAGVIETMPNLTSILALGRIAHEAVLRTLEAPPSHHTFGHGAIHHLERVRLIDSYHYSRYNTNTGRLTRAMFHEAIAAAAA